MTDDSNNLLRTRTRNLYIISSSIIVYLLAGADIGQLAIGAMKSPARYPKILEWAAIFGFIWFWWRYFIVWLQHRSAFTNSVQAAMIETESLQSFLKKKLVSDHSDSLDYMELSVSSGQDPPRYDIRKVWARKSKQLSVIVNQISFHIENDGIRATPAREIEGIPIEIPWWRYFGLVPFVTLRQALQQDTFGNIVLPNFVAMTAAILAGLSLSGMDPAGLFGLLDGSRSNVPVVVQEVTPASDAGSSEPSWVSRVFENPIALAALFISTLAVWFTIWRLCRDIRLQQSKDYLDASIRLLERAYETFEKRLSDKWDGLPEPDRVLWLTVARMLCESERSSRELKFKSHRILYEHARTFWRSKLSDILENLKIVELTYFSEDANPMLSSRTDQRSPICEGSIRVLLNFLEWPVGESDPIDGATRFTDSEIEHIRTFRYRSVGDYLKARKAMSRGSDDQQVVGQAHNCGD